MSEVTIDGLDETVIEIHRRRAAVLGRSLEEQLRELVTDAAAQPRDELVEALRQIRARNRRPPPGQVWPSAEDMVREDRDQA